MSEGIVREVIKIKVGKGFALADKVDLPYLSQFTWCPHSNGYAVRNIRRGRATIATRYMHREIMNAQKGVQVDHINGNRLDNRRENLRLCTTAENTRHSGSKGGKRKRVLSRFLGVTINPRQKNPGWEATMSVNGKTQHYGRFDTQEEAARARDIMAFRIRGSFALLNFSEIPGLSREEGDAILAKRRTRGMTKPKKPEVLPPERNTVALQKEHAVERDDAPSKVEFTISFNPFPAKVKQKAPKPKPLPTKKRALKPRG